MTPTELEWLAGLLAKGEEHRFYTWAKWQREREFVLAQDRRECQLCKAKGKYRRAVIVHHVQELRKRPDLALTMYDGERRQLLSVCKQCHEEQHPEALTLPQPRTAPLTAERWD